MPGVIRPWDPHSPTPSNPLNPQIPLGNFTGCLLLDFALRQVSELLGEVMCWCNFALSTLRKWPVISCQYRNAIPWKIISWNPTPTPMKLVCSCTDLTPSCYVPASSLLFSVTWNTLAISRPWLLNTLQMSEWYKV